MPEVTPALVQFLYVAATVKVKSLFFVMPFMVAGLLEAVVDPPAHEMRYPVA
jgi:hypothetical protein